jgi:hypothetical protein
MTSPLLQYIPLMSAYLCQDCDCVGNSATQCPACASTALMNLASVLNRNEIEVEIPMAAFTYATSAPSSTALAA